MLDFLAAREKASRTRLLLYGLAGLVVAGLLAGLAFGLGSWAYQYRRYSLHDGRLRKVLEQHPSMEQVRAGLLGEAGNWEMAVPRSDEELRALLAPWGRARAEEVLSKRHRYGAVRLFGVHDMVYALFIDDTGRLRDYALWSN